MKILRNTSKTSMSGQYSLIAVAEWMKNPYKLALNKELLNLEVIQANRHKLLSKSKKYREYKRLIGKIKSCSPARYLRIYVKIPQVVDLDLIKLGKKLGLKITLYKNCAEWVGQAEGSYQYIGRKLKVGKNGISWYRKFKYPRHIDQKVGEYHDDGLVYKEKFYLRCQSKRR